MRVAVFDEKNRLTGVRNVQKPKAGDVDAGDLPADGSYYWDAARRAFIPVGFGHGKVRAPSTSRDRAMYLLMTALIEGRPIPQECRDWCNWYERHGGGGR